ncbi:PTS sugar transporter subunit IIB [Enterococcus casseliflavus]|uniref:PTS sugar transporter subunit IIB n=1 Tax=Enterococcus casseliflavus TaxID=37734 RepID=UPI0018840D8B|nr:hypothetical protein [Enterococcus casseliflavus]MBE9909317.1 hypothetical protein [Enterococcus casseliflavus]
MKVTLVCASGITTSILAAKLNTHAKENNYNDFFVAKRVNSDIEGLLTNSNFFLIAPQVKASVSKLEKEAYKRNIPLFVLSEEDLVFGNVEGIYQLINRYRQESKEMKKNEKLSMKDIISIFWNATLRCLPLPILTSAITFISHFFYLELEAPILHLIPFFLAFSIGYQYGCLTKQPALSMGLLFLASSAFMVKIDNLQLMGEGITGVREGFIPLIVPTIKIYVLVFITSILTMFSINFSKFVLFNNKTRNSQAIISFIKLPFINGVVFMIMLIFRLFFAKLFH